MPTPEENMQSVRAFAEEVFGNKNLDYAADWLADDFVEHQVFPGTTPDKKGAIDSYRIFFAASPDPCPWSSVDPAGCSDRVERPSVANWPTVGHARPALLSHECEHALGPMPRVSTGRSVRLEHGNLGHHPGAS